MKIIPTILEKDPIKASERWEDIKKLSRWVSVDVIDGTYAYGRTFDLELISKIITEQNRLVEIHLMVKEPVGWINKAIEAGASRIIGQVEMMSNREEFVKRAKEEGLEVGLGWDIDTPFNPKEVPADTDMVLFMARKAGFARAEIEQQVWDKVKAAKKAGLVVGLDGGIDKTVMEILEKEGVDLAYVGSNYLNMVNKENE